ncbi:NAD(P)H-binding protein [Leptospira sp. 'Mane']|uniref:NmrA family NAD(P)-binding protein n=1 Tax=Leptospira sp. 'Mane' TaxID=3387407 RepID=UPI00398B1B05
MSIAVAVPTGNIAKFLLPKLISSGEEIIVLTRSPHKLDPLLKDKVKVEVGALEDAGFVERATKGVDALYWLNPGNKKAEDVHGWYKLYGQSVSNAVERNEIKYVVNISTIIPEVVEAGVADGIVHVEEYLNRTNANVVHLRPGFFLENILAQKEDLKTKGIISFPIPPNRPIAFIATSDIAEVASQYLLKRDWSGKQIHVLHGAEDITFEEAAKRLGKVTEHELNYVFISLEDFFQNLLDKGVTEAAALGYTDIYRSMHLPREVEGERSPRTTTSTTVELWGKNVLRPNLGSI